MVFDKMKWVCSCDGDCCELFSKNTLGYKCPMLNEDRSCSCYKTRPKACRVENAEIGDLDRDEYFTMRCSFVHMLKKWKDSVGDNDSVRFIMDKISNSGMK
jgi:hypothetical protein